MTKLTLGKTLSPDVQSKIEQLTKPSSESHQRMQPAQNKVQFQTNFSQHPPSQSSKSEDSSPSDPTHKLAKIDPYANERVQRRISRQTFLAAYKYLYDTYPEAFNRDDPKPLKLHIDKDIYLHLPENISRIKIRKVLSAYTRRLKYLQAFTKYSQRMDLTGTFVEAITEAQAQHAARALEDALTYMEQKRQYTKNRLDKHNT